MERKLNEKMYNFLMKKLFQNGLFHEAAKQKDARLVLTLTAEACVGIREKGGNNKGPMVSLIQDTVGGPDPSAWCMSFVQTCLAFTEKVTGIISPLPATEGCLNLWNTAPKLLKVKKIPLRGAIAIWALGDKGFGHTGIVTDYKNKVMHLIEGNTEKGIVNGKIERDGGGVYITERPTVNIGDMKLKGFLKPF